MTKQKRKYGPKPTRTAEEALGDQRDTTRKRTRLLTKIEKYLRKLRGTP